MNRVTIAPEGPSFPVEDGDDILGAGRRQGVWLPFECGWGSCSTCKVTLIEGEVSLLFPAAPAVTDRDRRRRRIVVCQSTPLTDLVIRPLSVADQAPPERPTVDRLATLVEADELGAGIRRFTFRADGPVDYRAGQHAIIDFGGGVRRCYSMAGLPAEGRLQFVAKWYGRPGSTALFRLSPGDRVKVAVPFGDVWLRPAQRSVVLIAGGTGISAILALAEDLARSGDRRPVRVFYGAATRSELVCSEELERYVGSLADAGVSEVLERPPPGWTGESGYVTDALTRDLGAGDAAEADYYLAGPPPMVDATLSVLARLGVSIDRVHYDRFG